MSNIQKKLPEGWKWVSLRDVCVKSTGTRNPAAKPDDEFIYIDISSIDNKQKKIVKHKNMIGKDAPSRARQVIQTGDILVSTTRPNLNAVAIVPEEFNNQICSTGFCVLRAQDCLNADYLFSFVQSPVFINSLSSLVKGALYPAVTDNKVKDQIIPIPPLNDQKQIAAILKKQFIEIEKARTSVVEQLEAAKGLNLAYSRKIFSSDKAKKWNWTTINDVCTEITDGTHATPTYTNSGVPFLSVKDVKETGLKFDDCRFISKDEHEVLIKRCKPERNDILYTKVGTTGIAKSIDVDVEFSVFVSVALLKIKPCILPEYMEVVLNSYICRAQADKLTQGAANRNLVLKDLKLITFPLPHIDEQKHLVSLISKLHAETAAIQNIIEAQLETINHLPAAILRNAFSGQI